VVGCWVEVLQYVAIFLGSGDVWSFNDVVGRWFLFWIAAWLWFSLAYSLFFPSKSPPLLADLFFPQPRLQDKKS